jgi:hypothetical protein
MTVAMWVTSAVAVAALLAACADDGAGVRDERPAPATSSPAQGY